MYCLAGATLRVVPKYRHADVHYECMVGPAYVVSAADLPLPVGLARTMIGSLPRGTAVNSLASSRCLEPMNRC